MSELSVQELQCMRGGHELFTGLSLSVGATVVEFVETLIAIGLRTSKVNDLAFPIPKTYAGALRHMSLLEAADG